MECCVQILLLLSKTSNSLASCFIQNVFCALLHWPPSPQRMYNAVLWGRFQFQLSQVETFHISQMFRTFWKPSPQWNNVIIFCPITKDEYGKTKVRRPSSLCNHFFFSALFLASFLKFSILSFVSEEYNLTPCVYLSHGAHNEVSRSEGMSKLKMPHTFRQKRVVIWFSLKSW